MVLTHRLLPLLTALGLATVLAFAPPKKEKKLVKVWETDSTLRIPESVLYDPSRKVLYVANIDGKPDGLDGNGFLSKVGLDGQIQSLKWVIGLNAPKGMGIHGNRLYVTDVYRLVAINLENGQAEQTWDAPDKNAFLNDVTVDRTGTVYVSDNRNNKIYRLKDKEWSVWMQGETLGSPNGLLATKKRLLIGSMKAGALQAIDPATKTMVMLADGMANTDGIVTDGRDNYFVSDWSGRLFFVTAAGEKQLLMDTREQKINSADIEYIPGQKLLVVPTFSDNRLVAYRVE